MSRVLIAVDFSDCGRAALDAGSRLALDLRSDIVLVHAFPEPMSPALATGLGYQELFQHYAGQAELVEALRLTQEWAEKARKEGLHVDVVARSAKPADLILEAANRDDVAMLVLGTHGRTGFRKLVLGSVAQDVIRRARKPTLVVPSA